jgi:hypothetical protein
VKLFRIALVALTAAWCSACVGMVGDDTVFPSTKPDGGGQPPSSAKQITSFSLRAADNPGLSADVAGVVTGTSIAIGVPFGTAVTALVPTVVHTGASVGPASGVAQDFTHPVPYTVTAVDGSTQTYSVTVGVGASSSKEITRFAILGTDGTLNGTNIAVTVPNGTDVTGLAPTITHTGVSVSPASGVPHDFTSPATYTVTAADGSTKAYTVTVAVSPSSSKDITRFTILGTDGTLNGTNIAVTVPNGTNITSLTPIISYSGVSVSPASGVPHDFTNPATYTVTAADGSTKSYTVAVSSTAIPAFNLSTATINSAPSDVAGWPETATINSIDFGGGVISFSKQDNSNNTGWPWQDFSGNFRTDCTGNVCDGAVFYTEWLFIYNNGKWVGSGFGQCFDRTPGSPPCMKPDQALSSWGLNALWYASDRWPDMYGHVLSSGETVAIMVTAGNERGGTSTAVMERSNVVMVTLP